MQNLRVPFHRFGNRNPNRSRVFLFPSPVSHEHGPPRFVPRFRLREMEQAKHVKARLKNYAHKVYKKTKVYQFKNQGDRNKKLVFAQGFWSDVLPGRRLLASSLYIYNGLSIVHYFSFFLLTQQYEVREGTSLMTPPPLSPLLHPSVRYNSRGTYNHIKMP